MALVYQELVVNLSKSKKVRHETLDGKKYLVAPAVLLTHGVHKSGNGKAIYYPETELNNMPSRWDHKPIVVYHPTKADGTPDTACQPAVLESRGCGFFLNTRYDGKLRTELWFDEVKTKKVDPRVMTALESETMMEISTGLYMDIAMTEGEFGGKKYDGMAQNFAPDHVAVLPDKVGACSIKDGGGMLQINEAFTPEQAAILNSIDLKIESMIHNTRPKEISVEKKTLIDYLVTNACGWEEADRSALEAMTEPKLKGLVDFAKKAKETPPPPTPAPEPVHNQASPATVPATVPATQTPTPAPAQPQAITINQLPAELQDFIRAGQVAKAELVKSIMTANGNTFTEAWLTAQTTEVLNGLARIANVPVHNAAAPAPFFGGQATQAPVQNNGYVQKPLPRPEINWSK